MLPALRPSLFVLLLLIYFMFIVDLYKYSNIRDDEDDDFNNEDLEDHDDSLAIVPINATVSSADGTITITMTKMILFVITDSILICIIYI